MRRLALLLALTACDGGKLVLDQTPADRDPVDVPDPVFETDEGADDTEPVVDSEPPADSDAETDPPDDGEPPVPDPLSWTGRLESTYKPLGWQQPCSVVVRESGDEVGGDAAAACSSCDHVFRVKNTPTGFCPGLPSPNSDTWRGVRWGAGTEVEIFEIERDFLRRWQARKLASGTKAGDVVTYTYDHRVGWENVPVTGSVTIK